MKPNDIIKFKDNAYNVEVYWKVLGVHLGTPEIDSLIEIQPISTRAGSARGVTRTEVFVPEKILRMALKGGLAHFSQMENNDGK